MKKIEWSVVESLDGTDMELFTYLPYILQDIWEIGADPSIMSELIKKNIGNKSLKILDLGCGKGAISIHLAKELNCSIKGIDAMPDFIKEANGYAVKYQVSDKCDFEVGDIRSKIKEMRNFDVVILGAIGPVLGNLNTTLKILAKSLNKTGYVLLDDSYIEDNSELNYDRCLRKSDFYEQIKTADFEIIQEVIFEGNAIESSDNIIYNAIEKRVNELILQYPTKTKLFNGYLQSQEYENHLLVNELVSGTWLLKTINAMV